MDKGSNLWYTKRVVKRGEVMMIAVGKTYKVNIKDCCVEGEFTSKLTKALVYDEGSNSDVLLDVEELDESNYGAELYFENGVKLVQQSGVSLTEVE